MRGAGVLGAIGFGFLVASGCAVGVAVDPGDESGDASTSTSDVTSTPPDSSTRDSATSNDSATSTDTSTGDSTVVLPDSSQPDAGCSGKLVINEVQTEGSGSGNADQEYIEIYNPSTCDVSLEGWALKYSSSSGSTPSTFFTGLVSHKVLAKGYFVVACTAFPGSKNATYTAGKLAGGDGQVGLFNKLDARVDGVGYGTITAANRTLTEANPAPSPGSGQSIQRTPNGADTDSNQVDFRSATPTPNASN